MNYDDFSSLEEQFFGFQNATDLNELFRSAVKDKNKKTIIKDVMKETGMSKEEATRFVENKINNIDVNKNTDNVPYSKYKITKK